MAVSEEAPWWHPEINGDGELDWLCDHLGDAHPVMARLWNELNASWTTVDYLVEVVRHYQNTVGKSFVGADFDAQVDALLAELERTTND